MSDFERGIPLPPPRTKYDFTRAEIGDSMIFRDEVDVASFRVCLSRHSKRMGKNWGTKSAPEGGGWRVWIVNKTPAKEKPGVICDEN